MADKKQSSNLDLDSILTEINTTISKEVSKTSSVKSKDSGENKTSERKSAVKKTAQKKNNDKKESTKKPAKVKDTTNKHKIDSAFANSAKIIEHSVEEDEIYSNHAVRFIAVTASEVVEPILQNDKVEEPQIIEQISIGNIQDKPSPISLPVVAPKIQPSPEVSRENNHYIKKLRKKQERPLMSGRQKYLAIIGLIVTVLVLIGSLTVLLGGTEFANNLINRTAEKEMFENEIYPYVIIDIPEFDEIGNLDNSSIISAAIWAFIIEGPSKDKYIFDDLGTVYVPDVDIEIYIRRLFGNDVQIQHQSVDNQSVMMFYDQEAKTYNIDIAPRTLPYTPRVNKITKKDNLFTLDVSYILPSVVWDTQDNTDDQQADKTMEYVLEEKKDGYQIKSVKLISIDGANTQLEPVVSSDEIDDGLVDLDDAESTIDIPADAEIPTPDAGATSSPDDKEDTSSDKSNSSTDEEDS